MTKAKQPIPKFQHIHAAVIGLLFAMSLGYLGWNLVHTSQPVKGNFVTRGQVPPAGDYIAFRTAGMMAARGQAEATYKMDTFMKELRPTTGKKAPLLSWAYPPSFFIFLVPFGVVPGWPGLGAWMLLSFAAAGVAGAIVAREKLAALWGMLYPGVCHAISCGQAGPFLALPLAMMIRFYEERPFLAGMGLGLLALKPHFAIGPGLIMLAERRFKVIAGSVTTVILLACISLMFGGIELWMAFLQGVRDQAQLALDGRLMLRRMISAFSFVRTLGVPNNPALIIQAICAAGMLAMAWHLWSRKTAPLWTRAIGMVIAALCLSPYAYDYDLALLCVAFAPLAASLGSNPTRWPWVGLIPLVIVASVGPGLYIVGQSTKLSFGFPVLVLLALAARFLPMAQPPKPHSNDDNELNQPAPQAAL
jgi:hypothetical protein